MRTKNLYSSFYKLTTIISAIFLYSQICSRSEQIRESETHAMYQQQVPQPRDEHTWSGPEPEAEYEQGYQPIPPQQINQVADAVARRLQVQQTPAQTQTPAVGFQ